MDNELSNVPVLLHVNDYMRGSCGVVKYVFELLEMVFDVPANGRRNHHVSSRVFESHEVQFPPKLDSNMSGQSGALSARK
jgi:hypothetical protein